MNQRSEAILKCIIEYYDNKAEPVGSRVITKILNEKLSAATVRNVMSDLTEMGLIAQPHTSSGRVPTDKGYRFYINKILKINQREDLKPIIDSDDVTFDAHPDKLEDILQEITTELSRQTNLIGILIPPQPSNSKLKKMELIKLSPNQVLIILITQIGLVKNKVVVLRECPDQETLNKISHILCSLFKGQTLSSIRRILIDKITRKINSVENILPQVIRLGKKAFDVEPQCDIFIYGHSTICTFPEFDNHENLQLLYKIIEDKSIINRILTDSIESRSVSIKIGNENQFDGLEQCSIISKSYGSGDNLLGTIGIMGPIRMNYPITISAIELSAQKLSIAVGKFINKE